MAKNKDPRKGQSPSEDYNNAQEQEGASAMGQTGANPPRVGDQRSAGTGERESTQGKGNPNQQAGASKVDGADGFKKLAEESLDNKRETKLKETRPDHVSTGYGKTLMESPTGYGGSTGFGGSTATRATRVGNGEGRARNSFSDNASRPRFGSMDGEEVTDQFDLETVEAETYMEGMMAPRDAIPTEDAPNEQAVTGTDESTYYVLDVNDHSYDFVKGMTGTASENFNTSLDEQIIPKIVVHGDAPYCKGDNLTTPSITAPAAAVATFFKLKQSTKKSGYYDLPDDQFRTGEYEMLDISFSDLGVDSVVTDGQSTILPDGTYGEYTDKDMGGLNIGGTIPVVVTMTYKDRTQDYTPAPQADKTRFQQLYSNIRDNRVENVVEYQRNKFGNNLSPNYQPYFNQPPELIWLHTYYSDALSDVGATLYACNKTFAPSIANMMHHFKYTADADALFGYFLTGGHPYGQQVQSKIGRRMRRLMARNAYNKESSSDVKPDNNRAYMTYLASQGCVTGACTVYDSPWKGNTFLSLFQASKYSYMSGIKENYGKLGNFAIDKSVAKRIDHAIEYGYAEDDYTDSQPVVGAHHIGVCHKHTFGSGYLGVKRQEMGNGIFKETVVFYVSKDRRTVRSFPSVVYKYQYTANSVIQSRNIRNPFLEALVSLFYIKEYGYLDGRRRTTQYNPKGLETSVNMYEFNIPVDNNLRCPTMWHYYVMKAGLLIDQRFKECYYDLYKYMYCQDYRDETTRNDVIVRQMPYTWLWSFLDHDHVNIDLDPKFYEGLKFSRNGKFLLVENLRTTYTGRPRWVEDLVWFGDKWSAIDMTIASTGQVTSASYVDNTMFLDAYHKDEVNTSSTAFQNRRYSFAYPSKNMFFDNKLMSIMNMRNITPRDYRKRAQLYCVPPYMGFDATKVSFGKSDEHKWGITLSQSRNATPGMYARNSAPVMESKATNSPKERRTLEFIFDYSEMPSYFIRTAKANEISQSKTRAFGKHSATFDYADFYIDGSYEGSSVEDTNIFDSTKGINASGQVMFSPNPYTITAVASVDDYGDESITLSQYTAFPYRPVYVAFRYRRPLSSAEWDQAGLLSSQVSVSFQFQANRIPTGSTSYTNAVKVANAKLQRSAIDLIRFENWMAVAVTPYTSAIRNISAISTAVAKDKVSNPYKLYQEHSNTTVNGEFGRQYGDTEFSTSYFEPLIYKLINDETVNEFDSYAILISRYWAQAVESSGQQKNILHPYPRMMQLSAGFQPILYQLAMKSEEDIVRDNHLTIQYDPFYDFEEWKESNDPKNDYVTND